MSTPQHLLLVTDMDGLMAVLVDPDVAARLGGDNDEILVFISEQDDDKVFSTVAEICKQVKMYDLEIVDEFIGAIY